MQNELRVYNWKRYTDSQAATLMNSTQGKFNMCHKNGSGTQSLLFPLPLRKKRKYIEFGQKVVNTIWGMSNYLGIEEA